MCTRDSGSPVTRGRPPGTDQRNPPSTPSLAACPGRAPRLGPPGEPIRSGCSWLRLQVPRPHGAVPSAEAWGCPLRRRTGLSPRRVNSSGGPLGSQAALSWAFCLLCCHQAPRAVPSRLRLKGEDTEPLDLFPAPASGSREAEGQPHPCRRALSSPSPLGTRGARSGAGSTGQHWGNPGSPGHDATSATKPHQHSTTCLQEEQSKCMEIPTRGEVLPAGGKVRTGSAPQLDLGRQER